MCICRECREIFSTWVAKRLQFGWNTCWVHEILMTKSCQFACTSHDNQWNAIWLFWQLPSISYDALHLTVLSINYSLPSSVILCNVILCDVILYHAMLCHVICFPRILFMAIHHTRISLDRNHLHHVWFVLLTLQNLLS